MNMFVSPLQITILKLESALCESIRRVEALAGDKVSEAADQALNIRVPRWLLAPCTM